MTTAGNLLVMVGSDSLDEGSRRLILDEGWRFYANDAVATPSMLWFALKVADGTEGPYTLFFTEASCPGDSDGYLVVVELAGGGITPLWDAGSGSGAVTWPAVVMLGAGIVFAVAITRAGGSSLVTAPAGYSEVDRYAFTACPDAEFVVWSKTVAAGSETPGPSDDPGVSWATLTLGLHAFASNVIEVGLMGLSPSPVGTPKDNGTDSGDDPGSRLDDDFPLPPDPSGVVVPGPTWEAP